MIRNLGNVFGAYRRIQLCQREKAVAGLRLSHVVSYREVPLKQSAITEVGAEIVGAAMWWWILWHLWHESEHITVITGPSKNFMK
ncbi:PREDICTED: NADH dehydrogenase [ubiquinone] 1 beta subcomplex subunit 2, mitochondrial-like [Bactrocera latifrons]|uniref:NADH dehydrogenase [ubiquinone] 1 beta subcomplex subunit 2, mitochondrial-like n=1 Tax=Bactrocera latifrons TaxID=174628 RepID=UPI0008DD4E29|nr:PREDICTED: NADH dehydrogenase [ubiquinone] 1 beta subcomplex subunit 2, mitochondrial-like [Bactrocera latifrons]